MIKPSSSVPRSAPGFARNRWISPRQVELLESLWSGRLRRAGRRPRPECSREDRLRHIAETIGRTVASSRELSWREANRVIRRLLEEVRSSSLSPATAASGSPKAPTTPRKRAPKRSPKTPLAPQAPTSRGNVRRSMRNSPKKRTAQP